MTHHNEHPATRERVPMGTRRLVGILFATAAIAAVLALAVTALLINIFERQQEARQPFFRVVELDDYTTDPAVWGKNFPLQYDSYLRTVDMERTRFGGSEALPRMPDDADPRTFVAESRLELDPRLRIMWAGYPFAVDYREARGHAYMLEDQTLTQRHAAAAQPGTCLHCHASVYVPYKIAGDGDIIRGFEAVNQMPFEEARELVEHPVACIDCHDPETMQLRITRPGFLEGIRTVKAGQGIEDYDPNTMATRQEMRAFVCAQCHVEYYFEGPERRLVYPWAYGLKADQILEYFEDIGFHDWIHAETGAPMIKVQHPEFELWNQGVHARAGVSCADCHMPYKRVGAMKVSDHHVRSPLLNINNACQTCHNVPEAELKARAEGIQARTLAIRDHAMEAVVTLIDSITRAMDEGMDEEILDEARWRQSRGTFFIDFVDAENSSGFHAPQEAARLLFNAMNEFRLGQMALAGQPVTGPTDPDWRPETLHELAPSWIELVDGPIRRPETGYADL